MSDQSNVETLPAKQEKRPVFEAGGSVGAIVPQSFEQAYRMADVITSADMAPKSYNRDANKVMVGIMHGLEVGLTPMAALQSIAVINGMPSIWGDGALALAQSSGLLEDIVETLEGEGDAMVARCTIRRNGRQTPTTGEFSVQDAKDAGLWGKAGPWKQYTKRMLKMRARGFALRDCFPDVLRGLRIGEEAQDMGRLEAGDDGVYEAETARPVREDYAEDTATVNARTFGKIDPFGEVDGDLPAEQFVAWFFDMLKEMAEDMARDHIRNNIETALECVAATTKDSRTFMMRLKDDGWPPESYAEKAPQEDYDGGQKQGLEQDVTGGEAEPEGDPLAIPDELDRRDDTQELSKPEKAKMWLDGRIRDVKAARTATFVEDIRQAIIDDPDAKKKMAWIASNEPEWLSEFETAVDEALAKMTQAQVDGK
jgi:hypothetical protein